MASFIPRNNTVTTTQLAQQRRKLRTMPTAGMYLVPQTLLGQTSQFIDLLMSGGLVLPGKKGKFSKRFGSLTETHGI